MHTSYIAGYFTCVELELKQCMAEFLDLEAAVERSCEMADSASSSRSEVEDSEGELSDELPMFTSRVGGRRRLSFPKDDVAGDTPNKRSRSSSCTTSKSKTSSKSSKAASTTSATRTPRTTKSSSNKSSSGLMSTSSGKSQPPYEDLLKEMKQSNQLLSTLVSRADSTEDRLKLVEEKLEDFSETNSTPKSRHHSRKRNVPDEVRVSGYILLGVMNPGT